MTAFFDAQRTRPTGFWLISFVFACLLGLGAAGPALAAEEPEPAPGEIREIKHPMESAANYFSSVARGGYKLYTRRCESCHGRYVEGTEDGPSLRDVSYLKNFKTRREFHKRVRNPIDPHRTFVREDEDGISFNHIEMIAKYLREYSDWYKNRPTLSDEKSG